MKTQKFTMSAAALLMLIICTQVLAQDAYPPLPSENADASISPAPRTPRDKYKSTDELATEKSRNAAVQASDSPKSTTSFRTFTSGAGLTLFRWTISSHGNIILLESPANFKHLNNAEGYVVSMNTSNGVVRYYDAGFAESSGCTGNLRSWSPTVLESGLNANGTTLARSTCDGAWRLTQTFLRNPINHELAVTMTLRNTSGFNYTNVLLSRYFDGDIDNDFGDDSYSRTFDTVEGRDSTIDILSLTATTFDVAHTTAIHSYGGWNPTVASQGSVGSPTGAGDFVGRVTYNLGTVNNATQKVVRVLYKRS
jgi:hypothetical protein